jgi:hypothetical protein
MMFLVVGIICCGTFGQPGAGDRVGWWWVCSSFVDEEGVVCVAKLPPPPKPPSAEYITRFLISSMPWSVVEWLLREKGWGLWTWGNGTAKDIKPAD